MSLNFCSVRACTASSLGRSSLLAHANAAYQDFPGWRTVEPEFNRYRLAVKIVGEGNVDGLAYHGVGRCRPCNMYFVDFVELHVKAWRQNVEIAQRDGFLCPVGRYEGYCEIAVSQRKGCHVKGQATLWRYCRGRPRRQVDAVRRIARPLNCYAVGVPNLYKTGIAERRQPVVRRQ